MSRHILVLFAAVATLFSGAVTAQDATRAAAVIEGANDESAPPYATSSEAPQAETAEVVTDGVQTVAIAQMPPYAVRQEDGRWTGPAVDLFRAAAEQAGMRYQLVERLPNSVGLTDAAVAFPVLATSDLPANTVQTLPFHIDSVGLIGRQNSGGFLEGLLGLFNLGFLRVVTIVAGLLLVVGVIFYLVERGHNDRLNADDGRMHGIGNGFWWAGVTATTIGYGDLVPQTTWGRVVAMIWMLFSMALTAILTAYIISITDASKEPTNLSEAVSDLRIGYVNDGSVAGDDLRGAEAVRQYATMEEALQAFDNDQLDAIAAPYQRAQQVAGDREVQRTAGSAVMLVLRVSGNNALRAAADRIILSPDWQARMDDQLGSQ